VKLNSGQRPQT